jgi:hypothetical protein
LPRIDRLIALAASGEKDDRAGRTEKSIHVPSEGVWRAFLSVNGLTVKNLSR